MLAFLLPLLVSLDPPHPDVTAEHDLITDITVGQVVAALVTIAVIIGFIRKINPIMHRLNDMLDDWNGEKARPGVPPRKGVMERLGDQDVQLTENGQRVARHEIDVSTHLDRISKDLKPLVDTHAKGNHQEVLTRLDAIASQSEHCGVKIQHLERLLNRHIREARAWVSAVDRSTAEQNIATPPWPSLPDDEDDDESGSHPS
jgi:hypothetical protein